MTRLLRGLCMDAGRVVARVLALRVLGVFALRVLDVLAREPGLDVHLGL